jgi:hypothetical protein
MRGVDHCWYIEHTHACVDHCWYIEPTHAWCRSLCSMYQQWYTLRMYVFDVPTMIYTTHVCVWCIDNDLHHACVCLMYRQWSTPRMCVFDVSTIIYTLHHACVCLMYRFCLCFFYFPTKLVNCSDGGVFFVFHFIIFLYLGLVWIDQENVILSGKHDLLLFVFMCGVSFSCLVMLHVNVICHFWFVEFSWWYNFLCISGYFYRTHFLPIQTYYI